MRICGFLENSRCSVSRLGITRAYQQGEGSQVLFLVVLLIVLWFLGVITKYTLGGLLHILLVVAIVFLLIGVIRGRGV